MKTSNKLLLGLFLLVVIAMVLFNFILKNEMNTPSNNRFETVQPSDTASLYDDSVTMDEANQNE
jgi:membrane carboxypeptidase/penicillin-binding protein